MTIPQPPRTLPEVLRTAAGRFPERGIAIFDRRGRRAERRSYAELDRVVGETAARFATLGVEPREPVLVALPTSWGWLDAWLGAAVRGAWPVAVSPGGAMGAAQAQLERVATVMSLLGARRLLCTESFRDEAARSGATEVAAAALTPDDLAAVEPAARFDPPAADPEEVALLQLTSGSTGVPRAVMISHRAAIHNPLASDEAIGAPFGSPAHRWADAMVSWLPLYHDMGLIGCLLLPLLTGLDLWLLRPETFLARPRLWLENLGLRGTTFVPAPNFAYQLCVERVEAAAGLDLSAWKVALTGAEMIRPETCRAFVDRFAAVGFAPEALRPCYGLAEATLAVTFDLRGAGVRTATVRGDGSGPRQVVCVGEPVRDTEITIVSPDGTTAAEGVIGEVRVRGPAVCLGYYNDAEATAETLRDGWLATGDLGFVRHGELYLTGRIKDILIIRGQNLMPEELEGLADGVTGGGGLKRSAAFSVPGGGEGEQAVVVVEIAGEDRETLQALERQVRVRIGRALSLPLADVAFVRRGRIPRTSSGKIRRKDLRQAYLDGGLDRVRPQP